MESESNNNHCNTPYEIHTCNKLVNSLTPKLLIWIYPVN